MRVSKGRQQRNIKTAAFSRWMEAPQRNLTYVASEHLTTQEIGLHNEAKAYNDTPDKELEDERS